MLAWLEKPIIRWPAYIATGLIVFTIAMAFSFPDDEIKEILAVEAEKALGHKYRVTIGELDLWRLSGVSLHLVSLEERVITKEPIDPNLPETLPTRIRLQTVRVRLAPIDSLLNLAPTVVFDSETGGGRLHGALELSPSAPVLSVKTKGLDLRQANLLTTMTGMPFFGELDLDIRFEFDSKFQPMDGHVSVQGRQLTIGPATIKTDKFPPMSYFEIPQTSFGTMVIQMEMERAKDVKDPSKLNISRFESSGRDIRMEMWGDITMAPKFGRARPKLEMRLQLDDSFVKDNSLAPLLNVAEFRKGKGRDWYGFVMNGTFEKLQFKGSAAASTGRKEAPPTDP